MLKTRKSDPSSPQRVLIHGLEGMGKSTFGANAERPVFITPEGSADRLQPAVDEIPGVYDWNSLLKAIDDLTNEEHNFKTLVLDSADWIEKLAHSKIIGSSDKDIIRVNGGYGAGYRDSQQLHLTLIGKLVALREKRKMNIVVTAHSHVRTAKDPDVSEDYDAYEIKCHEFVSSLWREWSDCIFFVKLETSTKKDIKKRAFSDGTRLVYTERRPAFQAKNRYGMPEVLPFNTDFWQVFMGYAQKGIQPVSAVSLRNEIDVLRKKIEDKETRIKIKKFVEEAGEDVTRLQGALDRVKQITKES